MHELAVALSLTEVAAEKAAELGAARVEAVHVRIGALAGVAADALAFSFQVASRGTAVEGARLVIEEVPVVVYCRRCGTERTVTGPGTLRCARCGTLAPDVRRGTELEVAALEVSDDAPAHR